jgi:hypothetical protein
MRRPKSTIFVCLFITVIPHTQVQPTPVEPVKLGMILDMGSLYADVTGPGPSSITNGSCIATAVHYVYNTYAVAHAVTRATMDKGGRSWYYVSADYTFGHQLESDSAVVVQANGGQVLGEAKTPINTADFSSFLLQAQQSGAQVIGLANAGSDLINAVKQAAAEFGITRSGTKLASLAANINEIHSIGLEATQGLVVGNGQAHGAVGSLQARGDDPGRSGVPTAAGVTLPFGEEATAMPHDPGRPCGGAQCMTEPLSASGTPRGMCLRMPETRISPAPNSMTAPATSIGTA